MSSSPRFSRRGGILARLSAVVVASLVVTLGGVGALSAQATPVPPVVVGITPSAGLVSGGTTVSITGSGFTNATTVNFGANTVPIATHTDDGDITAVSPAGTGTVDVTVTSPDGTSATTVDDEFEYFGPPTITSVTPDIGPESALTHVTITGTGFQQASEVEFGTTPVSFHASSDTEMVAEPLSGTGTVSITIFANGFSVTGGQYTFAPVPTVTSVNPNLGGTPGGQLVTIHGTGFLGTPTVTFGTVDATDVTVVSATAITATTPAGTGTVDVTVTTPGGTSPTSSDDEFTYGPAPVVSSISPTFGPSPGGTTVTITGTNFTPDASVVFGGTPATNVTFVSSTSITATSPAMATFSTVNVQVSTFTGLSAVTPADLFAYDAPPTVTGLSPTSGPMAGGTLVTITGTNFFNVTSVTFGSSASLYTVDSDTQITATSPANAPVTIDVQVTTLGGGTSATSSAGQFTYLYPAPTLNLSSTTVDAGGTLTVSGTGFTPNTTFDVVLHSSPVLLTTVTTNAAGAFSVSVRIPAATAAGAHTLVVGSTGIALTVVDPALASTGSDPSVAGGLAAGLLGIGLLLVLAGVRRRRGAVS